jgi:BlaI family penicillinase repressor
MIDYICSLVGVKDVPRISDTEWEVMRVVWKRHPITGNEIIESLSAGDPTWHPKTIRTLLARLVRKKALSYKAIKRVYVYSPLVSIQDCVATASESFLGRVFGGSLRPMLAHFVEQGKLTREDLAELRELVERQTAGEKNGND